MHPAQCLRERVANQFGAGHGEIQGSLKVICRTSEYQEIYAEVIVPMSLSKN
jgi:hypothetical protein